MKTCNLQVILMYGLNSSEHRLASWAASAQALGPLPSPPFPCWVLFLVDADVPGPSSQSYFSSFFVYFIQQKQLCIKIFHLLNKVVNDMSQLVESRIKSFGLIHLILFRIRTKLFFCCQTVV